MEKLQNTHILLKAKKCMIHLFNFINNSSDSVEKSKRIETHLIAMKCVLFDEFEMKMYHSALYQAEIMIPWSLFVVVVVSSKAVRFFMQSHVASSHLENDTEVKCDVMLDRCCFVVFDVDGMGKLKSLLLIKKGKHFFSFIFFLVRYSVTKLGVVQ